MYKMRTIFLYVNVNIFKRVVDPNITWFDP